MRLVWGLPFKVPVSQSHLKIGVHVLIWQKQRFCVIIKWHTKCNIMPPNTSHTLSMLQLYGYRLQWGPRPPLTPRSGPQGAGVGVTGSGISENLFSGPMRSFWHPNRCDRPTYSKNSICPPVWQHCAKWRMMGTIYFPNENEQTCVLYANSLYFLVCHSISKVR